MNILFDVTAADPANGGAAIVCRWFATRLVSTFPQHRYHAFTSNCMGRPLQHFQTAEAGEQLLEGVVSESRRRRGPVPTVRASKIADIYHDAVWAGPTRSLWRGIMTIRRVVEDKKDRRAYRLMAAQFGKHCAEAAIDVIHCPIQQICPIPPHQLRSIPYIMNLHDLQHEHFPAFFTESELRRRRSVWYASARASRFVVAAAKHVQDDIVRYTGLCAERVPLIPWGVPFEGEALPSEEEVNAAQKRYGLPEDFVFYPAVTWRHKNHENLLEALAAVRRDEKSDVHLVLTGGSGPWHSEVLKRVDDLSLAPFVRHLGLVPAADLKALYCLAIGVVVPSLHEQTSGPIMEAMALGCPVAGSNIADHLELLAEGSGLLFDPTDVNAISECIRILYRDRLMCRGMAAKGRKRLNQIRSWKNWAEKYMELYEICAKEKLC